MRDVINEAFCWIYVACKNRSGFPGLMPVGSDIDDKDVSVQAILDRLGVVPKSGGESPPCHCF